LQDEDVISFQKGILQDHVPPKLASNFCMFWAKNETLHLYPGLQNTFLFLI